MAIDTLSPRSRRAILAATLGALAGTVLARLGGPESARATNGGAIILGNSPSAPLDGSGINEASGTTGIYTTTGIGFVGTSPFGIGVFGNSSSNVGVYGNSDSNVGVYGNASSSIGVYGQNSATDLAAVAGRSFGNSTGVQGYSGTGAIPAPKAKTGVFGYAGQDNNSRGVYGESPAGHGVHGKSSSGWAGFFDGRVLTVKYHELVEIGTPAAPPSNHARLFVRDNGSGKTQLCVRFPTGAVKVLVTES
jgi:hypothetical protein